MLIYIYVYTLIIIVLTTIIMIIFIIMISMIYLLYIYICMYIYICIYIYIYVYIYTYVYIYIRKYVNTSIPLELGYLLLLPCIGPANNKKPRTSLARPQMNQDPPLVELNIAIERPGYLWMLFIKPSI